ncbi:interferon gamma-like isoform X2 [Limanda limanda]|uniref:interferon gamma-like isoform X2 n=1 Tax=Limanda limanda TaxID=27771 RepID=UPI0029C780F4|nr:interferon gamma-like isoform X2 [Limanda limanda]
MMVSTARAMVCLSLCLCVCQVSGSHIPARMNKTIQDLLERYKIPNKERFNGTPVFPMDPLNGTTETKRTFMGGVLETYEKLLGQMLEACDDAARADLSYILKKIQMLKRSSYQEQSKLLQGLHDLGNVQMDDRIIQSKALGELPWLYEEASSLMQRRRRRRQARKLRTRPSA